MKDNYSYEMNAERAVLIATRRCEAGDVELWKLAEIGNEEYFSAVGENLNITYIVRNKCEIEAMSSKDSVPLIDDLTKREFKGPVMLQMFAYFMQEQAKVTAIEAARIDKLTNEAISDHKKKEI